MDYKVYKITNIITNQIYIGITKNRLSHRFWEHINKKRNAGSYLYNSIQKYGKDNFTIKLLSNHSTSDEAKGEESRLILELQLNKHTYPNGIGLNLTNGGDGSYGCKHSLDSIQKMSGINNHNYGLIGKLNPTSKPINQYTLEHVYIQTFCSLREAAQSIKPNCTSSQMSSISTNIRSSILGRNGLLQSYGFTWQYI